LHLTQELQRALSHIAAKAPFSHMVFIGPLF